MNTASNRAQLYKLLEPHINHLAAERQVILIEDLLCAIEDRIKVLSSEEESTVKALEAIA